MNNATDRELQALAEILANLRELNKTFFIPSSDPKDPPAGPTTDGAGLWANREPLNAAGNIGRAPKSATPRRGPYTHESSRRGPVRKL